MDSCMRAYRGFVSQGMDACHPYKHRYIIMQSQYTIHKILLLDNILHISTRACIGTHFVHLDSTPTHTHRRPLMHSVISHH